MTPRAARSTMTIGALLAAVQEEFPDVTISKIRFLETEGLLTPTRTPKGYRVYTVADVERLRYILTAQRDRFWPLKVIGEALDALDRGLTPPEDSGRPAPPRAAEDPDVPTLADLARHRALRLTAAELAEAAGCDAATVEALEGFHLVRPDAEGHYGEDAVAVAHAAGRLAAYGLEPRHLRTFRTAADREIGLVEQALGPVGAGDDQATARRADLLQACLALHTALVKAGLHTPG